MRTHENESESAQDAIARIATAVYWARQVADAAVGHMDADGTNKEIPQAVPLIVTVRCSHMPDEA